MSEPFLAEIRIVGFNFAPRGWAFCDGQMLPINQNQSLYSLLGTTYGGDGRTTFALPDLRSRGPLHAGDSDFGRSFQLGQKGGAETVTLVADQLPPHRHDVKASAEAATSSDPTNHVLAKQRRFGPEAYADATQLVDLDSAALANAGASEAHNNLQPYTVLNFVIALRGLFPPRN